MQRLTFANEIVRYIFSFCHSLILMLYYFLLTVWQISWHLTLDTWSYCGLHSVCNCYSYCFSVLAKRFAWKSVSQNVLLNQSIKFYSYHLFMLRVSCKPVTLFLQEFTMY